MNATDVVVVGGGFAGLAAAAAFSKAGANVTVLEALDGTLNTFRGELLHPLGMRTLARFGLEEAVLRTGSAPVRGFATFDAADAEPVELPYPLHSPSSSPGDEASGGDAGMGFEHAAVVKSFRQELATWPRVRVLTRARVEQVVYEDGRLVGVRCADGREHRAPLIVGADGRHSKLRKLLGIPTDSNLLSYMVVPSLEGDVLPRPGFGHVFVGAPGPILAYPYGEGRVRMCIDVPVGLERGRGEILAYVREHYAPFLPEPLRGAMLEAMERGQFVGCANHAIYTGSCVVPEKGGGAALVGDAGGCSHPLTATGMTAALHDITTLLDCVKAKGVTDEALVTYQRRRYRFIRAREIFAHSLYGVFCRKDAGTRAICDGVFRYWRRNERARRTSMDILTGDESRVLAFFGHYARVLGISSWHGCTSALRQGDVRRAATLPAELLTTVLDSVRPLTQTAKARAQARAARRFHPGKGPYADAPPPRT